MQKRFSRKWKSLALLLVLALLTGSAWAQGLTVKGKVNGSTGEANDDIMPPMTGIRGGDAPRSGWSVAVPSLAVYNTWDDRDYRKQVSFDDSLLIGGVLKPYTEFANTKDPTSPSMPAMPATPIPKAAIPTTTTLPCATPKCC